jgi:predicted NBD/HSP70 family sugar kinase
MSVAARCAARAEAALGIVNLSGTTILLTLRTGIGECGAFLFAIERQPIR